MNVEEIRLRLGLDDLEEPFVRGWEASDRLFDPLQLQFLSEPFIRYNADLASLDEAAADHLVATAARAQRNEALCRLLWHEHRIYTGREIAESTTGRHRRRGRGVPFLDEEYDPSGFPDLSGCTGEDAPALNLLIALSAAPHAAALYEQRRIPSSVLRETLSDFDVWYRYYRDRLEQRGINAGTLSWLRFHLRGLLFRLGRLQFMRGSFPRGLTVYRGLRTGAVTALAAAGLTVDGDGLLLFGPDELDREERAKTWVTGRKITPGSVVGNPIHPGGWIERRQVELTFEEHRPILQDGNPVLEIHIPEGRPLDTEECADSLTRAEDFFPRYFPERSFEGFTCESWFLGREVLSLFGPDSNVARFADELYLYPCLGGEQETLGRIFGPRHEELDLARMPRETRLQRSVVRHLETGGKLREGGGFIHRADLPWGRRAYRTG